MIVSYDSVDYQEIQWLNRIVFSGYEFPHSDQMERLRQQDKRIPQDFAWYVKENNKIVSQVGYFIYNIQTLDGKLKTGIPYAVATLPNYQRKGFGKQVMEKVHERMREQGCKFSILSTSNRWLAHAWYQKHGYIDLASLCILYGSINKFFHEGWSIRPLREGDESQLASLFNELHKGKLGFITRPPNFLTFMNLWNDRKISIQVLEDAGKIIGYVNLVKSSVNDISEFVISKQYSEMDWIKFMTNGDTMIYPSPHQYFELSKYQELRFNEGDAVMMIKDLDEELTPNQIFDHLGTSEHIFTAHRFDRF